MKTTFKNFANVVKHFVGNQHTHTHTHTLSLSLYAIRLKQYMTLFAVSAITFTSLQAQGTGQEICNCEPTITKEYIHLDYNDLFTNYNLAQFGMWPYNITHPTQVCNGYIEIVYYRTTCGGVSAIVFQSIQFICPCGSNFFTVFNNAQLKELHKAAQEELLKILNLSTVMHWVYPTSCYSLAEVVFNPGDECYQIGDGGPEGPYPLGKQLISFPCDSQQCCSLTYELDLGTNRYIQQTVPVQYTCPETPPVISTYKIECYNQAGQPVTYYGNVISTGDCEAYCNGFPTAFRSDLSTSIHYELVSNTMDFNAKPTKVKEYIEFESTAHIEKIDVIDVSGKKITSIEQPTKRVNLTYLNTGVYYLRIQTKDLTIRSIKILKD